MTNKLKIRLLIVDNHPFMSCISDYLKHEGADIEVVAYAQNGDEAIEKTRELLPDIVLMDIRMPKGMDGIEATEKIKNDFQNNVKILALSDSGEPEYIGKMMKLGASGYFLKDDLTLSSNGFSNALKAVYQDITVFSAGVSRNLFIKIPSANKIFTNKEADVLQLVIDDCSNKTIAKKLDISGRTVETHKRNMKKKLDIHTDAGLVTYAFRNGLASL